MDAKGQFGDSTGGLLCAERTEVSEQKDLRDAQRAVMRDDLDTGLATHPELTIRKSLIEPGHQIGREIEQLNVHRCAPITKSAGA